MNVKLYFALCVTVQQEIDDGMPDFANMTEEEQIAFAMQMSMQDQRNNDTSFPQIEQKKLFFSVFYLQLMKRQLDKPSVRSHQKKHQWKLTR